MGVRSRRSVEPELMHPEERGEVVEPEAVEAEYEIVNRPRCLPGPRVMAWQAVPTRLLTTGFAGFLVGQGVLLLVEGVWCPGLLALVSGAVGGGMCLSDGYWQWPKL